jgi:hypothetical protein
MPEQMTSGGWVIAGWGFACGFAVASLVWLSYHWWYRIRTHVTVVGAGEQRINRVRDKAAIKSLRSSLATACRPMVARTALEVAAAYGSVRPAPKPPTVVPEPNVAPLVDVEYVPAPAVAGHRYSWPTVDRKATVVLGDAGQASELRRLVRDVSEGEEWAGRHRLDESPQSDDTRQFDARDLLDAVVVEAS